MSLFVGLACSAYAPVWAELVTLPAGQDHPDNVPVSKVPLVTRLVVAADPVEGTRSMPVRATRSVIRPGMIAARGRCARGFMTYKL